MSLHTRLCSNVLFPLHEKLKGHHSVTLLHELERTQWLPREAIEALQLRRLQALLAYAQDKVPYFRDLLGELLARHSGVTDLRSVFPGHDPQPGRFPGVLRS